MTVKNSTQGLSADPKSLGCSSHRQLQGFKAQLSNYFTGMGRIMHQHGYTSMIVFVINRLGIFTIKTKCDAPIAAHCD